MGQQTEMNKLVRNIRRLGYEVTVNGGQHWKVVIPGFPPVIMPKTPGYGRSMENVLAKLKKRGVHVKP